MKHTFSKGKFLNFGLKSFSIYNLILLAMLTAVSIAFKTIAGTLVRMITGPLGLPGGALAGGFYMLWLPLAIVLINKRGAALLVSAVQTIIMIATGAPGSHGIWTILTYMSPAIAVEIIYLYRPKSGYNILHFIFATMLANLVGTFGSNLLFFRLSLYPLMFALLAASTSGAIGGVIAWFAFSKVEKSGILKRMNRKRKNATVFERLGYLEYRYLSEEIQLIQDETSNFESEDSLIIPFEQSQLELDKEDKLSVEQNSSTNYQVDFSLDSEEIK